MTPLVPVPADQMPALNPASTRKVRALGWLLIVLGLCLSGGMAFLALWLQDVIVHNHVSGARSHWQGGPEFTRTVFELFAAVFVFGLVALAGGVFQVSTGRRSRALVVLMLLVVAAIIYLGHGITSTTVPAR